MMNLNALQRSFPSHRIIAHHGTSASETAILRARNTGHLWVVELHRESDGGWETVHEESLSANEAVSHYMQSIERAVMNRLQSNAQEFPLDETLI